jgi:hypothetical protein
LSGAVHDPVPKTVVEKPGKLTLPSQISRAFKLNVASPFFTVTALNCVCGAEQHTLISMRAASTGAPPQSVMSTTVEPVVHAESKPSTPRAVSTESAMVIGKRIFLFPRNLLIAGLNPADQGAVL